MHPPPSAAAPRRCKLFLRPQLPEACRNERPRQASWNAHRRAALPLWGIGWEAAWASAKARLGGGFAPTAAPTPLRGPASSRRKREWKRWGREFGKEGIRRAGGTSATGQRCDRSIRVHPPVPRLGPAWPRHAEKFQNGAPARSCGPTVSAVRARRPWRAGRPAPRRDRYSPRVFESAAETDPGLGGPGAPRAHAAARGARPPARRPGR